MWQLSTGKGCGRNMRRERELSYSTYCPHFLLQLGCDQPAHPPLQLSCEQTHTFLFLSCFCQVCCHSNQKGNQHHRDPSLRLIITLLILCLCFVLGHVPPVLKTSLTLFHPRTGSDIFLLLPITECTLIIHFWKFLFLMITLCNTLTFTQEKAENGLHPS